MQRILITGTSRGIGFEFVRQCLERGDWVFAACRNPEHAEALQQIRSTHLSIIPMEVTDIASVEAAYSLVKNLTPTLDVLINNAGIAHDEEKLGKIDAAESLHIFHVNAVAPMMIAQQFLDLLRRGANAKIINIVSEYASLELRDGGGVYSYSASKAALNSITRSLSFDLKRAGISVVSIDPGWVRTDMGGRSASLSPEESVSGMLRVIDRATRDSSGRFYRYDGSEMTW